MAPCPPLFPGGPPGTLCHKAGGEQQGRGGGGLRPLLPTPGEQQGLAVGGVSGEKFLLT